MSPKEKPKKRIEGDFIILSKTASVGGIKICVYVFAVFLVINLTGLVNWSWWLVTAPLWIPATLITLVMLCNRVCKYCMKFVHFILFQCSDAPIPSGLTIAMILIMLLSFKQIVFEVCQLYIC